MWEFRPGMKVVCVDDGASVGTIGWSPACDPVVVGKVYTIREIGVTHLNRPGVKLHEACWRGMVGFAFSCDGFYRAARFRPLVETNIDDLRAIVRDVFDRVPADAA